jgi:uncharacterized membrane protein
MKKSTLVSCVLIVLATLAVTLYIYPSLPELVPLHWNAAGKADRIGPKWELAVTMPAVMAGLTLMFGVLPSLSPRQYSIDPFKDSYATIARITLAMLAYIHVLTLWAATGAQFDMGRAILGATTLTIALIGNQMGKVRRNFWIGIRTPWTLADERVWYATHRFGGKTMVAGSLAALLAVLLGAPLWLVVGLVTAGAVTPALYSLLYYKRLERSGAL